ncbi:hypothetical protein NE850_29280 [Paraburkholderia sp. USG1]|uniref:hypothetical protein n=1 Tax=Paraburkholderia sp. USG1 TaxID=2952268 RepID=UPI0028641C14|nr:hypothetical protein [Paraburkholderia sp. USG1]MDR8400410.1 hypothetical protein [Paraburkholderia sp. USG1]
MSETAETQKSATGGGYRKTFDKECSSFLRAAVRTYVLCSGREGAESEFLEFIYNPMLTNFTLDPAAMLRAYDSLEREKRDYKETLRLACAYQIAAAQAFDAGGGGQAWIRLCRAEYYLGRTHQRLITPVMLKRIGKKRAGSGGDAKNVARNLARERARQLVLQNPGKYTSASHAAERLQKEVYDYVIEIYEDPARREKYGIQSKPPHFATSTMRRWFDDIDFSTCKS